MKMTKILSLVLALLMLSVCFVGCGEKQPENEEVYDITLWVSTTDGVVDFVKGQVEEFKKLHPEYKFNIHMKDVGEGDAATEVLKDVATAPDMYCFAQDQMARLVLGGALAPLGAQAAATITDEHDAGAINAATVGEGLYAYPWTSDNGYFLYYDSSKISDEQAKTFDGIVKACQDANAYLGFDFGGTAFVTASFFFSQPVGGGKPLCTSTFKYAEDGKTLAEVNDTFNSDNGVIAMKAMHNLANTAVLTNKWNDAEGTIALISGTWAAGSAKEVYGENLKATKLPTFKVDGVEYQLGSFSGYKFLGCKPQDDPKKAKLCSDLALYLVSEDAQLDRYFEFGWGPSNKVAQKDENVLENPILSALLQQNAYSQPEGVIPSVFWTELAVLGQLSMEPVLTEDQIREALETYEDKLEAEIGK